MVDMIKYFISEHESGLFQVFALRNGVEKCICKGCLESCIKAKELLDMRGRG